MSEKCKEFKCPHVAKSESTPVCVPDATDQTTGNEIICPLHVRVCSRSGRMGTVKCPSSDEEESENKKSICCKHCLAYWCAMIMFLIFDVLLYMHINDSNFNAENK